MTNSKIPQTRVWIVERADRKRFVLRWTDPHTGRRRQRTAEATNRRDAIKESGAIEKQLKDSGGRLLDGSQPDRPTWDAFVARYRESCLKKTSKSNAYKFNGMAAPLTTNCPIERSRRRCWPT